jgi:hypothetical protein
MDDNSDDPIKHVPLSDLKMEPGAEDLLDSAAMERYMNLAMAMMGGKDPGPAIEALAALPLEKRYVWRVASALKWAFADFDTTRSRKHGRSTSSLVISTDLCLL